MAVNRVDYNGDTLIDLTADTVTGDNMLLGATAHNAAGLAVTGTVIPNSGVYTGTDTPPPDGFDVWIDPAGTPDFDIIGIKVVSEYPATQIPGVLYLKVGD